jgi:hypothetical protein
LEETTAIISAGDCHSLVMTLLDDHFCRTSHRSGTTAYNNGSGSGLDGTIVGLGSGVTWSFITSPKRVATQAPTIYPTLVALSIAGTGASAIVSSVALSRPGTVYVWATTDASSAPGGAAIRGAPCGSAFVGVTGVTANVTCSSLTPLTAYSLFYYTEDTSVPSNKLPDSAVQASVRTVGAVGSHTDDLVLHNKSCVPIPAKDNT